LFTIKILVAVGSATRNKKRSPSPTSPKGGVGEDVRIVKMNMCFAYAKKKIELAESIEEKSQWFSVNTRWISV